ncbi:lysozyme inhibitor LprI family protein [Xanthobacter sp. KR7-65]|uniref:lysozyme inhibitor LprI family protein n=1 Tax=Xanthobacter sp. KR7-65 TaxID=3156612 RepID=UPI0032B5A105
MAAAPRRSHRRALIGLALIALALSPALVLLSSRAPNDSGADTGPHGPALALERFHESPAPPAPETPESNRAPQPEEAPPPAVPASPAVQAAPGPERWKGTPACPREKVSGGQYNRCLYDVTRTSEQALEAEVNNAIAVIEARTDLPGVQRARWKALLDEAQSRFLLFRNLDCQGVAPFEGPRGIGNFEQRALCLIEANRSRSADLRARYGTLQAAAEAAGGKTFSGPQDRPGTWIYPVPPLLD